MKKKGKKTCERFFSTCNQWYENKEWTQSCFVCIKYSTTAKTQLFTLQA